MGYNPELKIPFKSPLTPRNIIQDFKIPFKSHPTLKDIIQVLKFPSNPT
jgi:hypothetical protein